MFRFLIALALAFAAASGHAAETRRFAILSMMADRMLIAGFVPATEGAPERNAREFLPVEGGVIDKTALLAINEAILRLQPPAKPVLLVPQDPRLFVAHAPLLDSDGGSQPLLATLQGLAKGTGATHLILVTKLRRPARMRVQDRTVGSGMVEGVGFYVDVGHETRDPATGKLGAGTLWPFAYFRIELIDLARGQIEREAIVMASTPFPTAAVSTEYTWESLTPQQKVRALQDLVRSETERVIPTLLDR